MLAVLRDPEAEQSRRDQMAIQCAPYLHARLNAVAVSSTNGHGRDGGGDVNILQIYAVPRGALVDPKTGMITTIDGSPMTELPTVTPYDGTPALTDQSQSAPIEPPLPVHEVDVSNVTVLRRRDDDDDDPAGAA
jgi:hypothetical protein